MNGKIILLGFIASLSLWGWERGGTPVCQAKGDQFNVLVKPLANKKVAIAWLDRREGENIAELYSQVIDSLGNSLFTKDGIRVCDVGSSKRTPDMATNGENIYLVWVDHRVSVDQFDIYMEKINGSTGEKVFNPSGLPISTGPATEKDPHLALSPDGGAWIAWTDYRSGDADVWLARISPEGEKIFEVPVCSLPGGQGTPVVVPSGEGCLVFWGDSRDSLPGVYGQRITKDSPSGEWGVNGKLIIPFPQGAYAQNLVFSPEGGYFFPYAISDGQGGSIVHDAFITGTWQRIDSLGNLLWSSLDVVFPHYHIVSNEASGVIGSFGNYRDGSEPHSKVFAIQIDSLGKPLWGDTLLVWKSPYYDTNSYDTYPTLTDDSHQGAVITWVQSDYTGNKLLISRVDSTGKVVWDPPTIISDSPYEKAHPFVIKGPNKGYIVVYEESHPNTGWDIMGIYVDSTGQKGIEERDKRWKDNRILSVSPNPFEKSTVISFQLSVKASVTLKVYDATGKLIKTLMRVQSQKPGVYNVKWDGRSDRGFKVPSGVYFYRLETGEYKATKKLVWVR